MDKSRVKENGKTMHNTQTNLVTQPKHTIIDSNKAHNSNRLINPKLIMRTGKTGNYYKIVTPDIIITNRENSKKKKKIKLMTQYLKPKTVVRQISHHTNKYEMNPQ